MEHVRQVEGFRQKPGLCVPHIRAFCKMHDIDYRRFLREGVEENEISHIRNAFVQAVLRQAHGRK